MGFVRRLNSKELVGDPCAGAEVYPITATNAVYREGGENLEDILTRLGNQADRKVVQDISYIANTNKLHKEFTDNTTEDITLPNWIKNVTVTNSGRTYTITVTPTTGSASTYTIELPNVTTSGTGNGLSDISYNSSTNTITATKSNFVTDVQIKDSRGGVSKVTNGVAEIPDFPVTLEINQEDFFISDTEGIRHSISGTTALGNGVTTSGHVYPARLVTQGSGNAITSLAYSRDSDTTKLNRLNLNVYKGNFITDITCASGSDINTVGTPSVTSSINDSTTTLTFHQLKGANGNDGTNATITNVTATVDSGTGTPSCNVDVLGTSSAREFVFNFHNLEGTNGAPGKDSSTDVYDCNVSSEAEFKSSVATAWLGVYVSDVQTIQDSWLYSTPSGTIQIDGKTYTPKKVKVRIHIVEDFSITSNKQYGLENCEIYGDHHSITFSNDFIMSGYGCTIRDLKMVLHTENITNNNSWCIKILPINDKHSYFIFDDCQFNNSINTSASNSTKQEFIRVTGASSSSTVDIKMRDCNYNTSGTTLTPSNNPRIILNFTNATHPVLLSIFHNISMLEDEGNKTETNKFSIINYTGTNGNTTGKMRIFYDKLSDVDGVSVYSTVDNKIYHPNY